ncbi:MAG TPA: hypothetical protein VEQ61_05645 [Thermoleophilaceae bacterium]|nr:hypothetical protein [Thermoleophilaceae bacterium]
MLLGGMSACGGDGGEHTPTQSLERPRPLASERFAGPHYSFASEARPPIRRATVQGRRLEGGRRWLVVVRVRIANRLGTPLRLGLLSAAVQARGGRRYEPILADGRDTTKPAFARSMVPARGWLDAELVYRLPRRAIAGSQLAVRDPARRRSFELRLF